MLAGMLLMLGSLAQAGTVGAVLTAAFVANDPFIERRGLAVGLEWRPTPALALTADLGGYPNLGTGDHTALTRSLIDEAGGAPTVSRTTVRAEVGARWRLLRRDAGTWRSAISLLAGPGLSRTRDESLGEPNDPSLVDPVQVVPTVRAGVDAEVARGMWGARVSVVGIVRREAVRETRQTRGELWVGAGLIVTPSLREATTPVEPR